MNKSNNLSVSKRKKVARLLIRIILLPCIPIIALGYWASYDGDKSYAGCFLEIWRDI